VTQKIEIEKSNTHATMNLEELEFGVKLIRNYLTWKGQRERQSEITFSFQ
jgi:hypothetical protein